MIPKLRTIAILMLLAGLSLGIFASRALRAMAPETAPGAVSGGQPMIDMQVERYQRDFLLSPQEADLVRQELYLHDQLVRDRLWKLRQDDEEWFRTRREALEQAVTGILEEARKGR